MKADEMKRIFKLVDNAYKSDPRIAKFKEAEKNEKLAKKQAKLDLIQAKKDKEEMKKALKMERKKLRNIAKEENYFCSDEDVKLSNVLEIEKMCEMYSQMQ